MFEEQDLPVLPVEQLRQVYQKTEEELYDQRLKGMVDSIMSTIVKLAGAAKTDYTTGMQMSSFPSDEAANRMLNDIVKSFESGGYKVTTKEVPRNIEEEAKNLRASVTITVDWSPNEVAV